MRPSVEPVERRDLPSATAMILATQARQASPNAIIGLSATGQLQATATSPGGLAGLMGATPTPAEQAAERFRGVFAGPLSVLPPRFTDQSELIYLRATGGTTTFMHGDLQLLLAIPKDPSAPVSGVAVMLDKNTGNSGLLALDVTGSQADFDALGRPTRLAWSITPFAGAGSFTSGAFSLASGQGTIDLRYGPPPVKHKHSLGNRVASAVFTGTLFTPGTFNPLTNANLVQSHKRLI